jgi:hypothetical protein
VISFEEECFVDCSSLISIKIFSSIKFISNGCFQGCVSLQNISFCLRLTFFPDLFYTTPINF